MPSPQPGRSASRRGRSRSDGSSSAAADRHVPRETEPPWAARAFGPALPALREYADLLTTAGVERGLLGPGEPPRLWSRHLANCAALAPALPRAAQVCDLGSGAGLPGVVLAVLRPDLSMTLLEPMLRRATFLEEVVAGLRLTHARVVRARAEAHHETYDVVTARAVAGLPTLASWGLPRCRPGGVLLAIRGRKAEAELSAVSRRLPRSGATFWRVQRYPTGPDLPPTTVVRVALGERHRPDEEER